MDVDRRNALQRDPHGSLTPEEMKEGWHWCDEFDGLLTDGEIMSQEDELVCVCGFDRRRVDEYLAKDK